MSVNNAKFCAQAVFHIVLISLHSANWLTELVSALIILQKPIQLTNLQIWRRMQNSVQNNHDKNTTGCSV